MRLLVDHRIPPELYVRRANLSYQGVLERLDGGAKSGHEINLVALLPLLDKCQGFITQVGSQQILDDTLVQSTSIACADGANSRLPECNVLIFPVRVTASKIGPELIVLNLRSLSGLKELPHPFE